jgi:hypothetical protein
MSSFLIFSFTGISSFFVVNKWKCPLFLLWIYGYPSEIVLQQAIHFITEYTTCLGQSIFSLIFTKLQLLYAIEIIIAWKLLSVKV